MSTDRIEVSRISLADPFSAKVRDLVGALEAVIVSSPIGSQLPSPVELAEHLVRLTGQQDVPKAVHDKLIAALSGASALVQKLGDGTFVTRMPATVAV